MWCSKWEKQLLQGILRKFKRQQPDFSIISKTIFSEDPLRHAVNSQPTWTEEGREGSLTYMKCVFCRQTICGKERKKERRRGGGWRWRLHLWHHRESISHEFCIWTFITCVNARQAVRDLQTPSYVKALTHADYRSGHPPFKPDKCLSGWTFTTYVSLSGGMKDPYASDERKSLFLAGFRCNVGCST